MRWQDGRHVGGKRTCYAETPHPKASLHNVSGALGNERAKVPSENTPLSSVSQTLRGKGKLAHAHVRTAVSPCKISGAFTQCLISPTVFRCDDPLPHTRLSLYIHSLEIMILSLRPRWPVDRWLAWMPRLSGPQISSGSPLKGLITQWPLHCRPPPFSSPPRGLPTGCTEHELLQKWAFRSWPILLSFPNYPIHVKTAQS